MSTIKFDKTFILDGKTITGATFSGVNFSRFITLSKAAQSKRTNNSRYEVLIQRERIVAQCTFLAGDERVPITHEALSLIPAWAAKLIVPALDMEDSPVGTVLQAGDGIETPILYKLGTPIKGAAGADITELEFLATSYSDIETVLAGTTSLYQTLDLISTVAKPVGSTLLAMPSWAADQVSLTDGIEISLKVLPNFLD